MWINHFAIFFGFQTSFLSTSTPIHSGILWTEEPTPLSHYGADLLVRVSWNFSLPPSLSFSFFLSLYPKGKPCEKLGQRINRSRLLTVNIGLSQWSSWTQNINDLRHWHQCAENVKLLPVVKGEFAREQPLHGVKESQSCRQFARGIIKRWMMMMRCGGSAQRLFSQANHRVGRVENKIFADK